MADCDHLFTEDQWDISDGNPVVRKVVADTDDGVDGGNCENGGNVEVNVHSCFDEMMLANLLFPQCTMLLSDPNVWMADTAASVHSTSHYTGLITTKGAIMGDSLSLLEMVLMVLHQLWVIFLVSCVINMVWKLYWVSFMMCCICWKGSSTCSVCHFCKLRVGCCTEIKIVSG